MSFMTIERKGCTVEFETPELYVDNQARKRSGHMSHALAEFAPGCIINFNANSSAVRADGHAAYGWVEYRISRDAGKTYGEVKTLPYSWDAFLDGLFTVSVEKVVACDDGSLVAFCLRNGMLQPVCCEPWMTPTYIRSFDQGETWTEPVELSPYTGRIYDALYKDGVIYVMHCCGDFFLHQKEEDQHYRLYKSIDNGATFEEVSIIPFPQERRSYGNMIFDQNGRLHAYGYNDIKERELDHAVSDDNGKTWTLLEPCYLDKAIRNPQVGYVDGVYVMHGRSEGALGFVFYTSEDATTWDEGTFLNKWDHPIGQYYSNNITLEDEQGKFLLVQYSESYDGSGRVNIKHTRLRVKPKA